MVIRVEKHTVETKVVREVEGRSGRGDRRGRVYRTREGNPRVKDLEGRKEGRVKVGARLEEEEEEDEEDEGTGQAPWV